MPQSRPFACPAWFHYNENRKETKGRVSTVPVSDKELINILRQMISQQEKQLNEQNTTIQELRGTVSDLRSVIANLEETLAQMRRKMFGTSSEKVHTVSGENDEMVTTGEEKTCTVKEHTRTRKPKSVRTDLYASLPVREVKCQVPDEERACPDCGTPMGHMSYSFVREEIRIIPAKVERVRYMQEKVACPACREEDDTTIRAAETPTPLLDHSPASPSIVATVMYDKSGLYLPFYRQEKDWEQKRLRLPRETIANWYNQCAALYLAPVYNRLHEYLVQRDVLHADEIPCQVLREPGKEATARSYFWIYLTGNDGKPGIVLFDYQPGRKGEYPLTFLSGFSGFLHCDGYSAYKALQDVILLCCLAHARRKFFEAVPKERQKGLKLLDINSEQALDEPPADTACKTDLLPAEKGVAFCNRLFFKERLYKDLPAEERKVKRLETERPIWDEFWKWLDTLSPAGKSKLEKAVTYAINHKETLMNYLKDGRCEISNNAAERKAKVYATARKNFLFHCTVEGATASAIVMSLIETAKANRLNPCQYLYMLSLYMPDYKDEPAGIEKLMPWSDFIQERCKGLMDMETITPETRGKLPV